MNSQKQPIRFIDLPQIDKSTYRRTYAGLRPWRRQGIRVEKETISQKHIYHNYGHGGAGVSLCPATASQTAQLVAKENTSNKNVAVLGSGMAGLTTALQLAERGFNVTVYAKIIPKPGVFDNDKLCTAEIAPGKWTPYFYHFQNKAQYDGRSLKAYQRYKSWFKKFKSLSICTSYEQVSEQEFRKMIPDVLEIEGKKIKAYFSKDSKKSKQLIQFKTIKIHLMTFLQEVIGECKDRNVKFVNCEINSRQEILNFKEEHIVNCLGFSSKKLFGDNNLYGLKGHLLEFANPQGIEQFICIKHDNKPIQFYCHKDKILVGLTSDEADNNKIDPKRAEQLFKLIVSFKNEYQKSQPSPKL